MVIYEPELVQKGFPDQAPRGITELAVQQNNIREEQGQLRVLLHRAENPDLFRGTGHT
jgi:hypothetical protein